MPEQKYASFAVEDLRENSQLFDDVDATITNVQFVNTPPSSAYQADGNPIFARVEFLLDGTAPEEERRVNQSYSLGATAGDQFTIASDGFGLIPKDDMVVSIRKGCKWAIFVTELQKCGVPSPLLRTGNFQVLVGLRGHFKRIPDPVRVFANADKRTKPGAANKPTYPPSTLCLAKLIAMPSEHAVGGKSNGAMKGGPILVPAPVIEESGDIDADTTPYLMAALNKAKGKLQRGQILIAVSRAAEGHPQKLVYGKRAQEEDYLNSLMDIGVLKYAPTEKGQPITAV